MHTTLTTLVPSLAILICTGIFIVAAVCIVKQLKNKYDRKHAPFAEMKRPVGEYLRAKIEDLDDQINERLVALYLIPFGLAFFIVKVDYPSFATPLTLLIIGVVVYGFLTKNLLDIIDRRRNCRLGFDGERYVGEELARLVAMGFTIYHDVQFVNGGNIDHVAVGSRGVFVIETKTRRKYNDLKGNEGATVGFDGKMLYWPRWQPDDYGVQQAMSNAQKLSAWIKAEAGETLAVKPVLTLPGWWVDRKGTYPQIYVCNPKEIYKFCQEQEQSLEPSRVEKICAKMEENCKIEVRN